MSEKKSDVTIIIEQITAFEKTQEKSEENLISFLQELKNALQVSHWNTDSYAQHVAFDLILGDITGETDTMIEAFQGKYERISTPTSIRSHLISQEYIEDCIGKLNSPEKFGIKESDKDLLNIRDEITGTLHKLKYLLSLK